VASVGPGLAAGEGAAGRRPTPWQAWGWALRPRTLPVGAAPVLVGSAVAASQGGFRPGWALAALGVALLLQVGSNLANDAFDHERGADTQERLGPARATAQGWIPARRVKAAAAAALGAAALLGLPLALRLGWPALALGGAAVAAAWLYTGGRRPYGYAGAGDPAVFAFFGPAAVCGTAAVQTGTWSGAALAASLPVGALATAVLVVNNLRDVETDARAGKRTLAVRLGARGARWEYTGLLALAALAPPGLALAGAASPAVLLAWGALPLALPPLQAVWGPAGGPALNEALGGTARLLLVYAAGLAFGFWPWGPT